MSDKINLRMLDPKPLTAPAAISRAEATLAPRDDADVVEQLDRQEQTERAHESEIGGWIGGALGAAAGALALGIIAATLGVWLKWLSIGIGFTVALGVRKLGRGSSRHFGVIGATWAFVGCVLAYHLACCILFAREQGVPVMEYVRGVQNWSTFMVDVLGPRDFAIYAAAMAAGYKFSYSNLSDEY
jgi:hypothetical protein